MRLRTLLGSMVALVAVAVSAWGVEPIRLVVTDYQTARDGTTTYIVGVELSSGQSIQPGDVIEFKTGEYTVLDTASGLDTRPAPAKFSRTDSFQVFQATPGYLTPCTLNAGPFETVCAPRLFCGFPCGAFPLEFLDLSFGCITSFVPDREIRPPEVFPSGLTNCQPPALPGEHWYSYNYDFAPPDGSDQLPYTAPPNHNAFVGPWITSFPDHSPNSAVTLPIISIYDHNRNLRYTTSYLLLCTGDAENGALCQPL